METKKIEELLESMLQISKESYEDFLYAANPSELSMLSYYEGKKDAYQTALKIIQLYRKED